MMNVLTTPCTRLKHPGSALMRLRLGVGLLSTLLTIAAGGCSFMEVMNTPEVERASQPPGSFTVEARADGAHLAWRDDNSSNSGYRVERSSGGGDWQELASVADDAVRYRDYTVCFAEADTSVLHYRVAAVFGDGESMYSAPQRYTAWTGTPDCEVPLGSEPLSPGNWVYSSYNSNPAPLNPHFDRTDRLVYYEDTLSLTGHDHSANNTLFWSAFLLSLDEFDRIEIVWEPLGDASQYSENSLGLRAYSIRNNAGSTSLQVIGSNLLTTTSSTSAGTVPIPDQAELFTRISRVDNGTGTADDGTTGSDPPEYTVATAQGGFPGSAGATLIDENTTVIGEGGIGARYRIYFRYNDTTDSGAGILVRSLDVITSGSADGGTGPVAPTWGIIRGLTPNDGVTSGAFETPTLAWDPVTDATGYELQTASDIENVPDATAIELSNPEYTLPAAAALEIGDSLYWRVRAVRDGGEPGPWSLIREVRRLYTVGETGPAGGIVFHDKGSVSDGWRFLESALADVATVQWGGYGTEVGDTGDGVGSGQANTASIVAELGTTSTYAARSAAEYESNGFDDWFLPSMDELGLMYDQRAIIPSTTSAYYWSSSEANSTSARARYLTSTTQATRSKTNSGRIRPIRAF